MDAPVAGLIRQHLIDPEICIRCNTCEATCPVDAITHDDRNYVVDASICNGCMDCVSPCPTGSIDNWRAMPKTRAYTVAEQFGWDELPAELSDEELQSAAGEAAAPSAPDIDEAAVMPPPVQAINWSSTTPPASAEKAQVNLYTPRQPAVATVVGNLNCTEAGYASETHHLVLDFGTLPFPVLEGQSIGIVPPGVDANGRPHHARQYSIASARNGERPGYNNLALTVKRVVEDHDGHASTGVCSNYLCDAAVGDTVQVIGPFGQTFLMPNHPRSHLVMVCTGTGSAPMRAMTEWRRRRHKARDFEGGRLMLFFGARTPQELPYFGPLKNLPKDLMDINLAFSRVSGEPKRYVQDAMRERAADLVALLRDDGTHLYVCGLKSMEEGVVQALRDVSADAGLDWVERAGVLKREGRIHFETY